MNEELYMAWLEELETTEIQQAIGALNSKDAIDCLGICCNAASRMDPDRYGIWDERGPQSERAIFIHQQKAEETRLPQHIRKELNFATIMGRMLFNELPDELKEKYLSKPTHANAGASDHHVDLATLNDYQDFTFKDIARVLRERPKSLFMDKSQPACTMIPAPTCDTDYHPAGCQGSAGLMRPKLDCRCDRYVPHCKECGQPMRPDALDTRGYGPNVRGWICDGCDRSAWHIDEMANALVKQNIPI